MVDADLGLAQGDLRAAERTFQLLSQVTGRAGRSGGASRALLQTFAPDHPVMRAIVAGDREAFYAREIAERREAGLPPFGRLAGIVVSGPERGAVQSYAAAFAAPRRKRRELTCSGRPKRRWRSSAAAIASACSCRRRAAPICRAGFATWLAAAPAPRGGVRVQVDIDPQSFL